MRVDGLVLEAWCDEAGLADEISPIVLGTYNSKTQVSPGSILICRTTNRAAR